MITWNFKWFWNYLKLKSYGFRQTAPGFSPRWSFLEPNLDLPDMFRLSGCSWTRTIRHHTGHRCDWLSEHLANKIGMARKRHLISWEAADSDIRWYQIVQCCATADFGLRIPQASTGGLVCRPVVPPVIQSLLNTFSGGRASSVQYPKCPSFILVG